MTSQRAKRTTTPALHSQPSNAGALDHAVRVIHHVCCVAGSASLISDIRAELQAEGIPTAIRRHDTAPLFDWLMAALSYQGISDRVATDYMEQHGRARWRDIEAKLGHGTTCPKLTSYWHFNGCRYDKISRTCAEPDHIGDCPVPSHDLRNGRLNQTAYSLYLFIRDIADGDLVGWIDRQLREADQPHDAQRPARLRAALIEPLQEVYGVSDKVLTSLKALDPEWPIREADIRLQRNMCRDGPGSDIRSAANSAVIRSSRWLGRAMLVPRGVPQLRAYYFVATILTPPNLRS